jgi:hypothetical protein
MNSSHGALLTNRRSNVAALLLAAPRPMTGAKCLHYHPISHTPPHPLQPLLCITPAIITQGTVFTSLIVLRNSFLYTQVLKPTY